MQKQRVRYDRAQEPIVISKSIMDLFLDDDKVPFHDLLALYSFYYYTAKWQGTNQPRAVASYCANALAWSERKVRQVKGRLMELGLVEDVKHVDPDTGKVKGWYVRVKFIWSSKSHPAKKPRGGLSHGVASLQANASSVSNGNASSTHTRQSRRRVERDREPIAKRTETLLPVAQHLAEIIKTYRDIKTDKRRLRMWAGSIRKLVEKDGVSRERIDTALSWYEENANLEYVPVIESGSSLRDKFTRLEAAMRRDGHRKKPKRRFVGRDPRTKRPVYEED